jgi:hypothetical protein
LFSYFISNKIVITMPITLWLYHMEDMLLPLLIMVLLE